MIMDKPLRNEMPDVVWKCAPSIPAATCDSGRHEINRPPPQRGRRTLADYAVRLRYEDLPADVVRTVRRTILDTIGCAIGGNQADPSQRSSWRPA